VPDVLDVNIVTPVADNPDQLIAPWALRILANTAVGAAEFGVLLKVMLYVPVVDHATVTLAALLLLAVTLAELLP
jgi:hypothetical protein